MPYTPAPGDLVLFTPNIWGLSRPRNRPRYPLGFILEGSKWAYMGETVIGSEGHSSASVPCLFIDNFPGAQGYFTLMRAAVQAKAVLEKVKEFAERRVQLNTNEDDKLYPNLLDSFNLFVHHTGANTHTDSLTHNYTCLNLKKNNPQNQSVSYSFITVCPFVN